MNIFEYKRQGGKLIGISFNYTKGLFFNVKIYGDFFVFPVEEIDNLEESIDGKGLTELSRIIEDFFSSGIMVYGITAADLKEGFKRTINEK